MTTNLLTPTPAAMAEHIKNAQVIVVVYGPHSTDDIYYTAQALTQSLLAAGKTATIAASHTDVPKAGFLTSPLAVHSHLAGQEFMTITVPLEGVTLDEVGYDTVAGNLEITVVPKVGRLLAEQVVAKTQTSRPNMIITLGVNNLEDLGALYAEHVDMFLNTPRFNLLLEATDNYSATWNWVTPHASCYAELVLPLLDAMAVELNSETATTLLAALVAATETFAGKATTAASFELAARLVAARARHSEIVRRLPTTKPFARVKLGGRALARLTVIGQTALYTSLAEADFQKTELSTAHIPEVLQDIVEQISGYESIFLTTETREGVVVWFAILPHSDIVRLAHTFECTVPSVSPLGVGAYQYGSLTIPGSTQLAVEAKLREFVTQ